MSKTKQPLSGLLILVVVVSLFTGGLAGYFAAVSTQQPSPQVRTFGANLWLVTMNDSTSNRAFNTTYHNVENSGGQAMIVNIMVSTQNSYVIFEVNNTAAYLNTTQSLKAETGANFTGGSDTHVFELTAYVPWNFYYRLNNTVPARTNATSKTSIVKWFESIPPTGFGQIIQAVILSARKVN